VPQQVGEQPSLLGAVAVVLVFEARRLGEMELGFRHRILIDEAC
jgi:hypothetical protein